MNNEWGCTYVKATGWADDAGKKLYRAKFTCGEFIGGHWAWSQWVEFWATRPTAACREIVKYANESEKHEPLDWYRKVVN